jgi:hypothetical protein
MRALPIAVVVTLAASLASVSRTGSAEPLGAVVINVYPSQFCCPEIGTWAASGAVGDSGSYERTEGATAPPDRPPFALGPFREVFVFTGSRGTFTVRAEERLAETGVIGVWQIASGTDDYADASGHGTVAFFNGPPLTLSLTGVISKVAEG